MNINKPSILILDAEQSSSLAILRSLSRQDLQCDIASAELKPLARYSRYANGYYQYPNPLTESESFIDFMVSHLELNQYDLVIPVTERTVVPLAESSKLEPWRSFFATANSTSLEQVINKSKTLEIARINQIPHPFSFIVESIIELENIASTVDYPLVIKPNQSISNNLERKSLSVKYAFDKTELIKVGKEMLNHSSLLIQQYVQGEGTGIELLADHGEIVFAFQHLRIHELPLTGGGSCLRKSIALEQTLLDAARKLIAALKWHGVAMVEFKWRPETNEYWLMEINGRFWGSLPLACVAGANFPYMLYNLIVHNITPTSTKYRQDIYCRKLSADIQWYEQILRRSSNEKLFVYPNYKKIIYDFLLALHPTKHYFDVQCWHDPLPGFVDFLEILTSYFYRIRDLFQLRYINWIHQSYSKKSQLKTRLKKAKSILFLCYGNINRSALAQVLSEKYYQHDKLHFNSAGFHPVSKRKADKNMASLAAESNIDLSSFSSKTVDDILLNAADIIFVMEAQQYLYAKKTFPAHIDKIFLLGSVGNEAVLDISDPYNKPIELYRDCFIKINRLILQLSLN